MESIPMAEPKVVVEQPIVKEPKDNKPKDPRDNWEIKDRRYVLRNGLTPLSYSIASRNQYYFDTVKGYEREICYTKNQNTPFTDEMKGQRRLGRIVFRNGVLFVPKEKVGLQQFLSLFHPKRDKLFFEVKPQLLAKNELENINLEVDALLAARECEIDMAEAIMRVEIGSKVSSLSSKELKRDLMVFAKRKPKLFLDLMKDDSIHLRNIGIKAREMGIINLSGDQRTFSWASTGRKLLQVPFEEHPYSALAAWFKTDEGMEILQSVEKQL